MNRRDAAGLLTLVGVAVSWASLSGAVLDYLRPGMRMWVAVAGGLLVVLGAVELWSSRDAAQADGHGGSRVGWLVALPVCVAVTVGSGSLGVYAVDRGATFRDLPDAPTAFDLEQYVRAQSFGGQPIELTLVDLIAAAGAAPGREILADHQLEAVGFISRADDGTERLTRFVISCCAADGRAVHVELQSDAPLPEDGTWVRIVGTLAATTEATLDPEWPALRVDDSTVVREPDHPYEVPVSRIR